ncbi:MAG: hypothetical protein IJ412_06900 [Oscillospiraceae bacterium]|nr:hypothetical protein [Oscillospiraceae bacterium]
MIFSLRIYLDVEATTSVNWLGKAYYTETHFDNIEISNGMISISGHRSSPFDLKKILFNNTSTLYFQIAKTLAFYYLCSGCSLSITKMELTSDIYHTETETDFLQPFTRKLEHHQNIIMHSGVLGRRDVERIGTNIRDWISQVGV